MAPQQQVAQFDLGGDTSWDLSHPAVMSIAPDGLLADVQLPTLRHFLWHELPLHWAGDLEFRLAVAAELGERFAAEGMTDHAELCVSAQTEEIIWTYATAGHGAGLAAYRQAILDSSAHSVI